jgi:hypothetical protein
MPDEPDIMPPRPWHLPIAPLAAMAGFALWSGSVAPVAFLAGFAGWVLAMVLRAPVAAALNKLGAGKTAMANGMLLASGPAEEITRWAALLLVGHGMGSVVWLGLGWSLSEALFSALSVQSVRRTLAAGGAKAAALEDHLRQAAPKGGNRLMAGLERLSATAAHVGFSVMVAAGGPWVVAAMAAHTLFHAAGATALSLGKSVALTEAVLLALGLGALALGYAVYMPI